MLEDWLKIVEKTHKKRKKNENGADTSITISEMFFITIIKIDCTCIAL